VKLFDRDYKALYQLYVPLPAVPEPKQISKKDVLNLKKSLEKIQERVEFYQSSNCDAVRYEEPCPDAVQIGCKRYKVTLKVVPLDP